MKECIIKALYSPINWFARDENFCKKFPRQIPFVCFLIILLGVSFLLYGYMAGLFFMIGSLCIFHSQWTQAVPCFLTFLLPVCVFWLGRIVLIKRSSKQNQENAKLIPSFDQNGKQIEKVTSEGGK